MYSCLLVDDEEDVITAILHKIDWNSLGYEVPRYAHNGLEALDLSEESMPDVVMTDIKMPYMDGLELSRQLKELYPNIRIIIFSGFDEFEYAKEAIRLEAEEYILKPIDPDELRRVFTRLRESLDKEADERQNIAKLSHYYEESLPLLQENLYIALVEGRLPEKKIAGYLLNYQIDLKGPYYCAVILHTSTSAVPEGLNPVLVTVSVRRLAEDRLREQWSGHLFTYLGDTVMIAQLADPKEVIALTDSCDRFCRLAGSVCKAAVTAGIGYLADSIPELPQSMDSAAEAVSYRALYGNGKAINIAEIVRQDGDGTSGESGRQLDALLRKVRTGEEPEIAREVKKYLTAASAEQTNLKQYSFFVIDLVSELHRFAAESRLDIDRVFGRYENLRTLEQMDLNELTAWMTDVLNRMSEMIREEQSDKTQSFVVRAQDYIRDHYADESISIESICHILGVSTAYFSTVFKKETGKTFVSYLTDYRMEKAAALLRAGSAKTYVVAKQVGYSDPNYFSYVFKRKYGLTPSRYRSGGDDEKQTKDR